MKNEKGQTLVLFILLLPIIVVIVMLVINYGTLSYEKLKLENNLKSSIRYGLNLKKDEEITDSMIKIKMEELLKDNVDYDSVSITVLENSISVNLKKSIYISKKKNDINITYYGRLDNDKIIIEGR